MKSKECRYDEIRELENKWNQRNVEIINLKNRELMKSKDLRNYEFRGWENE